MSNPNFQFPTLAKATENQRVYKATAALDTLIVHYDLDNMSEREIRTLHSQLTELQTHLTDYTDDVMYAAEQCEPERIECECCESNNTRVDYDFLDDEMVWCFACNDYTHLAQPNMDESQESIERHETAAIEASNNRW